MAENIDDLVSAKAFADMERLNKLLNDTVEKILVINKNGILQEAAVSSSKGIKETSDAVKKLADNNEQLATTITEVKEAQVQATAATNTYTTAINNQQKAELKAQQEASAWAAKQQVNTTKQTAQVQQQIVSINSLTEANKRLRKERDALDISGNNNKIKIEAINKALERNNAMILSNSDAMKKQSANVGNYSSALNGIWSGLRKIAYIVPGLGIAGIFDIALTALTKLVDEMDIFNNKAIDMQAIRKKGIELSTDEITKADSLYKATQNLNIPLKERNNYVDELQKMYPSYFANFSNEEVLAGKAANAYDRLKKSIMDAGIARAIQEEMGLVMKEMLKLELANVQREEAIIKERKSRAGGQPSGVSIGGYSVTSGDAFSAGAVPNNSDPDIEREKQKQQKRYDGLMKVYQKYLGGSADLEKSYEQKRGGSTSIGKGSKDTREKEAKEYLSEINALDREVQLMNEKTDADTIERIRKRLEEIKRLNAIYAKDELDLIRENLDANEKIWAREEEEEKKLLDAKLQNLNTLADAIRNTTEILSAISDIQYSREILKINERDKALENSYDNEKKAIEASGYSKEKKEKMMMELDAKREQQRKQIDRERITAERKRAMQQKAFDVAGIITATALATVKQLAATPLPAGAPFVALVLAAGAAQLARAIAAPLPQYKHGTKDHKGGLAIVGDGGESELVVEPSGNAYMTAAKATIMDLPAHTQVFNQEQMMQGVNNLAFQKLGNGQKVTTDSMTIAMLQSFDEMTRDMKGIKKAIGSLELGLTLEGDFARFLNKKNIIS